jgi:hypothetical protein
MEWSFDYNALFDTANKEKSHKKSKSKKKQKKSKSKKKEKSSKDGGSDYADVIDEENDAAKQDIAVTSTADAEKGAAEKDGASSAQPGQPAATSGGPGEDNSATSSAGLPPVKDKKNKSGKLKAGGGFLYFILLPNFRRVYCKCVCGAEGLKNKWYEWYPTCSGQKKPEYSRGHLSEALGS